MEAAEAEIERMAKDGLIEPSNTSSPWNSPVVMIRKSDLSWRFCLYYRILNNITVKQSQFLPRIDDTLDALSQNKWFSTLDLKSGYHQLNLANEDRPKTAFSLPGGGLWQFTVLPFGLCNAPAVFEKLMLKVLSGLPWKTCLVYLDDIMIMGKTFEEHIKNLEEVMQRLRDANLKLNPKKCELFRKEVTFLGHVVSEEGVATNSEKIKTVQTWPVPNTIKQVRSFLGLCSYYRRFICKFAEIARPLHQLTEANQKFHWSDDCQSAFKELKTKLISTPILSYPRDQGLFILDADASNDSMGAVLSQVQDGYEKVICYYSKVFHKAERKYCVTRRELLAVVSSVKQFHHYLYGHHFLVRSDHGALSEYDFEIQHQAGKSHGNADALSRRPCEEIDCNKCCKSEEKYGNENLSLDNESKNTSESLKNNVKDKVVYIVTRSGKTTDNLLSKLSSQTQGNCSKDSDFRCGSLREKQLSNISLKVLMEWKEKGDKPVWEQVSLTVNQSSFL